ncbi:hypothetical protein QQS21_003720 [Conoideocrella luteorostrata]|uniref:Uncharacterized protein n=1 Tax=Conoideocrella luteorostrata TaxID=1105319 RepID=A0AAJ0CSU8_9HYPO|nr:hypothetical protein QQS21_003720 [Conoideocrella luteorostrata]
MSVPGSEVFRFPYPSGGNAVRSSLESATAALTANIDTGSQGTTSTDSSTFYVAPASLRGVPIGRVDEESTYWENSWDSLDQFIAQESEEKALKEHYQDLKNRGPPDLAIQKRAKFHQDNMSKHIKIREIFGDNSAYHPNQLVSKLHSPREGFCQKELMYRVACKISDLKVLNRTGHLKMDAWDFLRWRISLKLNEHLSHVGESARDNVRTTIYKISDDGINNNYKDDVLRQAILLSAQHQHRLSSFRTSGNKFGAQDVLRAQPNKPFHREPQRCRPRDAPIARPSKKPEVRAKTEARQERRRQLAAQSSEYQGVNAFRAQQRERMTQ